MGPSGAYWGLLRFFEVFCPKNRFWAVICMGTGTPSDKRPLAAIEALAREKPTQLIAQLRAIWPQVQQALEASHTLRLIHKRLNMAGVEIRYKRLIVYRRDRRSLGAISYALASRISRTHVGNAFPLVGNNHVEREISEHDYKL